MLLWLCYVVFCCLFFGVDVCTLVCDFVVVVFHMTTTNYDMVLLLFFPMCCQCSCVLYCVASVDDDIFILPMALKSKPCNLIAYLPLTIL